MVARDASKWVYRTGETAIAMSNLPYERTEVLHEVEMCRIKAQQKNVALVCHSNLDLPAMVRVDEKRPRQVLVNLQKSP